MSTNATSADPGGSLSVSADVLTEAFIPAEPAGRAPARSAAPPAAVGGHHLRLDHRCGRRARRRSQRRAASRRRARDRPRLARARLHLRPLRARRPALVGERRRRRAAPGRHRRCSSPGRSSACSPRSARPTRWSARSAPRSSPAPAPASAAPPRASACTARPALRERTLILGSGTVALQLVQRLQRHQELGLDPVGYIDDDVARARPARHPAARHAGLAVGPDHLRPRRPRDDRVHPRQPRGPAAQHPRLPRRRRDRRHRAAAVRVPRGRAHDRAGRRHAAALDPPADVLAAVALLQAHAGHRRRGRRCSSCCPRCWR